MFLRETERFRRGTFRYLYRRITLRNGTFILAVRTTCADGFWTTASPLRTMVMARRVGQILPAMRRLGLRLIRLSRYRPLVLPVITNPTLLVAGAGVEPACEAYESSD
jgi:hypothetical protein